MRAPVHNPKSWRPRLWGWTARVCVIGASLGLSGCKDPTVVLTTVQPGNFVPLFTQLTLTLTSASDPSIHVSSNLVSLYPGSYDGGLPAIPLPDQFPVSVDPDYLSGAAIVRADGIDNATGTLLATGTAPAQVVPQKQTEATVTLSPVACQPAGTDGGSDCDGGADDAVGGRDAAGGG